MRFISVLFMFGLLDYLIFKNYRNGLNFRTFTIELFIATLILVAAKFHIFGITQEDALMYITASVLEAVIMALMFKYKVIK